MVRFLSSTWFDRLRSYTEGIGAAPAALPVPAPDAVPALVLRHQVRAPGSGLAGGDASDYDVVVAGGRAVIRHPALGPADLTFTSDYPTAAAIAAGRLSTRAALAEGRLRVAGDVGILSGRASCVADFDPVPAALRAETEF